MWLLIKTNPVVFMCMMLSKCRKYAQHHFTPLPHLLWNEVSKASNDYLRKEAVLIIMSELQLRSSKYEIETIVPLVLDCCIYFATFKGLLLWTTLQWWIKRCSWRRCYIVYHMNSLSFYRNCSYQLQSILLYISCVFQRYHFTCIHIKKKA